MQDLQILQICKSAKSANSTGFGQNGPKTLPLGQKFRLGFGSTLCGARTFLFFNTPPVAPPLHFFDFLLHSEAKYRLVRMNSRFCRFLQILQIFCRFCRFLQIFSDFCRLYFVFVRLARDLIIVMFVCVSGIVLFTLRKLLLIACLLVAECYNLQENL